LRIEADRGARDQRLARRDAGAVERVARGEVVRAVEDHIHVCQQRRQVLRPDPFFQRRDVHVGIQRGQRRLRRVDFCFADRIRAEEDLPLQVGEVDLVRVGEGQLADAAGGEIERRGAAQAARADDQRVRRSQPLLALDPDFIEQDVTAVAEELLVVQ
jgi:hypothetical protein